MKDNPSIAFIGGGAMALALAKGFLNKKCTNLIRISEPRPCQHDRIRSELKHNTFVTASNKTVIESADVIFLAVKPQVINIILEEISSNIKNHQLVISIAAGISLQKIQEKLLNSPIIRVMPNTPALVGEMACGFSGGVYATKEHCDIAKQLLGSIGTVFQLDEKLLDAVTGLSGSGPAYVFMMIEALADGGVRAGLPRNVALSLATKTVYGSAKLLESLGKHPAVLKDMVASPGGTTITGIHELENSGFRSSLINAVYQASKRSEELGKQANSNTTNNEK